MERGGSCCEQECAVFFVLSLTRSPGQQKEAQKSLCTCNCPTSTIHGTSTVVQIKFVCSLFCSFIVCCCCVFSVSVFVLCRGLLPQQSSSSRTERRSKGRSISIWEAVQISLVDRRDTHTGESCGGKEVAEEHSHAGLAQFQLPVRAAALHTATQRNQCSRNEEEGGKGEADSAGWNESAQFTSFVSSVVPPFSPLCWCPPHCSLCSSLHPALLLHCCCIHPSLHLSIR